MNGGLDGVKTFPVRGKVCAARSDLRATRTFFGCCATHDAAAYGVQIVPR